MLYPFTVKNIESKLEGTFDVLIMRQKVLNYTDPATETAHLMTPTIIKFEEFYHVTADTEEAAKQEIAKRIVETPLVYELDMLNGTPSDFNP